MKLHPKTWILIADGARARILQYHGPGQHLTEVAGHTYDADHSATHDIVTDNAGRSYSSVGPGRSAIEPHTDPHRDLKTQFAHRLNDVLQRELAAGAFDKLIVVATPVTLGDLRQHYSAHVKGAITGEVAKDLTKTPDAEIASHLGDVLNI